MVKRKLDGAVDESSADRDFCKPYITSERSGMPALSGTGSYGRQAGRPAGWQFSRQNLGKA